MKLSDQITRRHLFVAFGSSAQTGTLSSVDLAATRDGSSVTLTASDGSVAPIAGADASTAGVLTAADKARLDALPPTSGQRFSARAGVASATIDAAITHLTTAGYAAPGDGGGAVYRRVGAGPAHALKVQSADGAWWELLPDAQGYINVKQAGAKGDDTANDGQAFQDCLAYAQINAVGNEKATNGIYVPEGRYYLATTTLQIKKAVHITSGGTGIGRTDTAALRWDANVTGIIVHEADTIDATTEVTPSGSGAGSRLERLRLVGGGGTIAGVTDGSKGHGIWLRGANVHLANIRATGFAGNGFHIVANVGAPDKGSANQWYIEKCSLTDNFQNGIFTDGNNANAGLAVECNASMNGRWGIWNSSVLSNSFVGCHVYQNGVASIGGNGAGQSSLVEYAGNLYAAHRTATEAQLVSTTPGTDESVWIGLGAGTSSPNRPTWQALQLEGTYFTGGPVQSDYSGARTVFLGCYVEDVPSQGPSQLVRGAAVVGGQMVDLKGNPGGFITFATHTLPLGKWEWDNSQEFSPARKLTRAINDFTDVMDRWIADGDGAGLRFRWDESEGQWVYEHNNSAGRRPLRIQTALATKTYGRASAIIGGSFVFGEGFWVGDGDNARHQFNGTGAPTGGEWAQGDIVWNRSPAASGKVGWVCVSGGTPGTWKAFGAIDA